MVVVVVVALIVATAHTRFRSMRAVEREWAHRAATAASFRVAMACWAYSQSASGLAVMQRERRLLDV